MSSFRKIKYLSSCVVKIQKYKSKNFLGTQCYRCQAFGHSSKNCNLSPRCVKCTGYHLSQECEKKDRSEPAHCCNCGEKHPANYRLCSERQKYLKLLENKKTERKSTQSSKRILNRVTATNSKPANADWPKVAATIPENLTSTNITASAADNWAKVASSLHVDHTRINTMDPPPPPNTVNEEHPVTANLSDETTAEMLKILMAIRSLKNQLKACHSMIDKVVLILSYLGQYV